MAGRGDFGEVPVIEDARMLIPCADGGTGLDARMPPAAEFLPVPRKAEDR